MKFEKLFYFETLPSSKKFNDRILVIRVGEPTVNRKVVEG